MHYHHGVLYARYVQRINELGEGRFDSAASAYAAAVHTGNTNLREQAAQAILHEAFFASMTPGGSPPSQSLDAAVDRAFGSWAGMHHLWCKAASEVFGSGWVHLCAVADGRLQIVTSKDAWLPLQPSLLTMDVWEHAYYLDFPAQRDAYASAWLSNLAHWTGASRALARVK